MDMTLGLYEDEVIMWKGKPDVTILFAKDDIIYIPLSLILFFVTLAAQTFAIEMMVIYFDMSSLGLCLFILPFFALGLYFLFGRFIRKYYVKKNEEYYLTSQRVIIKAKQNIKAMPLNSISQMTLVPAYSGCGTLLLQNTFSLNTQSRLSKKYYLLSIYHNAGLFPFLLDKSLRRVFVLRDIPNAEEVYRIISGVKNTNP